jgi:hypothetical protein
MSACRNKAANEREQRRYAWMTATYIEVVDRTRKDINSLKTEVAENPTAVELCDRYLNGIIPFKDQLLFTKVKLPKFPDVLKDLYKEAVGHRQPDDYSLQNPKQVALIKATRTLRVTIESLEAGYEQLGTRRPERVTISWMTVLRRKQPPSSEYHRHHAARGNVIHQRKTGPENVL